MASRRRPLRDDSLELPVLIQEFVSPSGESSFASRTYCPVQGRSIPVEECRRCSCYGSGRSLRCRPERHYLAHPAGRTAGRATREGVIAVETGTSAFDVAGLFLTRHVPFVMVVDRDRRVTGIVTPESVTALLPNPKLSLIVHLAGRLAREELCRLRACDLASADLAAPEALPLEDALSDMRRVGATALAVVASDGAPLGTLRERDARQLLRENPTMPPPPPSRPAPERDEATESGVPTSSWGRLSRTRGVRRRFADNSLDGELGSGTTGR